MKKTQKRATVCVIIGILIFLLFIPFSPSAASSQLGFVFFIVVLGAFIIGLWMLAPTFAPIWEAVGRLRLLKHPFVRFVAKKGVFYLIVAFIAFTFIFLIPRLMPGNPVDQMIDPGTQDAERQRIRSLLLDYYGLDKPLQEQYIDFWGKLLTFKFNLAAILLSVVGLVMLALVPLEQFWSLISKTAKALPRRLGRFFTLTTVAGFGLGLLFLGIVLAWAPDLGVTISTPSMPVATIVMDRLPFTLALVIPVLFISFFVGNWIGARAAYVKNKRSEAVYFLSVFGNILPFYWLAMVLLFLLAWQVRIFPWEGTFSSDLMQPGLNLASFIDALRHYALPFLTLLIVSIGGWATGMRSMTLYELDSGYILYARQLGFRNKKLMGYAKRNAILPQFTGLNINLNNLIGQTMIIEMVFGWRGIGLLSLDAIHARDYTTMLGTFLITMIIVIVGNFLVDIAYAFIDPRIRTGQEG